MVKRIDLVGITPGTTAVLWEGTGDGERATGQNRSPFP
ncbi:MAG: hypothetical protein CLLPBCKN_004639 [Chroococcidiopsis cubana SAG 39.79]|nr:hypothetical protein [Chroococcidiopsis cubana SAG 39.79]